MQIVSERDASFATLFVYDSAGQPTFFTATLAADTPSSWLGDLYRTSGPYFGSEPFAPTAVVARKVGQLRFRRLNSDSATLIYDVDGTGVTKSVTRQTLHADDYSGTYTALLSVVTTHCSNSADNRSQVSTHALTIAQTNSAFTMTGELMNRSSCTYAGVYTQAGKMGSVGTSYTCASGDEGTMNFYEMTKRPGIASGRVQGHSISDSCDYAGSFTALIPN